MSKILSFLKREAVMTISFVLALVSVFFIHVDKEYAEYIDIRTLAILFSMMLITSGIRKYGFFDAASVFLLERCKGARGVTLTLVLMCFFFSMLITNDVVLITLVPFAIQVLIMCNQEKLIIRVVVLMTVAANLGSMATPVGNPQNLYLYGLSGMSLSEFFSVVGPYVFLSFILIVIFCIMIGKGNTGIIKTGRGIYFKPKDRLYIMLYGVLFVLELLSVLRLIPYEYMLIAIVVFCIFDDGRLLLKADYSLLLTFVFLFVFIGNMKRIPEVYDFVSNLAGEHGVTAAVGISQVISNVPAAILLSGFTTDYKGLIVGCNMGGLGTLIASMASLISYKAYCRMVGVKKMRYIAVFTIYNLLFLAALYILFLNRR